MASTTNATIHSHLTGQSPEKEEPKPPPPEKPEEGPDVIITKGFPRPPETRPPETRPPEKK